MGQHHHHRWGLQVRHYETTMAEMEAERGEYEQQLEELRNELERHRASRADHTHAHTNTHAFATPAAGHAYCQNRRRSPPWLQATPTCCSTLRCVAARRAALQHVALCWTPPCACRWRQPMVYEDDEDDGDDLGDGGDGDDADGTVASSAQGDSDHGDKARELTRGAAAAAMRCGAAAAAMRCGMCSAPPVPAT